MDILIDLFCAHLLQSDTALPKEVSSWEKRPKEGTSSWVGTNYINIHYKSSSFYVVVPTADYGGPDFFYVPFFIVNGRDITDRLCDKQKKKVVGAIQKRYAFAQALEQNQKELSLQLQDLDDIEKILKINAKDSL